MCIFQGYRGWSRAFPTCLGGVYVQVLSLLGGQSFANSSQFNAGETRMGGLAGFQQARPQIFCILLTISIMLFSDSFAPCCGQATREIIYSWNEGLNWTHFEFWDHTIEVENIITEPTGTSQVLGR